MAFTGNGGKLPGWRGAAHGGIPRCDGGGGGGGRLGGGRQPAGLPGLRFSGGNRLSRSASSRARPRCLPPRRPAVPAASAVLVPEPNMAAVVKVFDSHEGGGEGKKGGREVPGPKPAPAAAGARGTGGRRLGKCRGGTGPGGPRGTPAADTRGEAAFPVSALSSLPPPFLGGRERWATGIGNRRGQTGPLRPARALRGGYRGPGAAGERDR